MLRNRKVLLVVAGGLVLPTALLAAGAFAPSVPWLGSTGMWIFPALAGPLVIVSVCGTAAALAAARRGARLAGGALALIGVISTVGAGVITTAHLRVAAAYGVTVNLAATIVPRPPIVGARPDETVAYAQAEGRDLRLDIYRPAKGGILPAPVAIHVHGGGWIALDRTVKATHLRWLADRGYMGMSIDYQLARPETPTWQTAGAQVACALAWAAANAARYGGDPARLFLFGESAGGALALTTAYAAAAGAATSSCGGQVPAVRAVAAQVPGVDVLSLYQNRDWLHGAAGRRMVSTYLGGSPIEHPDRARAVHPGTYITRQAPPTFIMLNDDDRLVPIEGARQFIARAKDAGVSIRVIRFPWADHGAGALFYSVINQAWLESVRQHFCRHGACG